jgi:excisionase family DNA binding protein
MDEATAAAYLQLSRRSLRRLLARERLGPLQLGLRLRRWRRTDLDALLERLPLLGSAGDQAAEAALAAVDRRALRHRRQGVAADPASSGA